jgi:cyclopropane-fatty-acyl-phospholipid synthase
MQGLRRVMAAGDIGFAEGYVAGDWDTPDLAVLLEVLGENWDRLNRLTAGSPLVRLSNRVLNLFRRNTREGSRRNIHAHYDLGNAFYAAWLDPGMTYSSGLYAGEGDTLEQAQRRKYAALARSIDLQPGHTVLEIGCGWGGFAEYAAREIGAHVTGLTISPAQHAFARERMARQGLSALTDIRLQDYREVEGTFDRVVSIEMFEAVGEAYWPTYFQAVRQRLRPGGRAGLQVITIRDDLFGGYRSQVDFIQKYVFPGGMLPSEGQLRAQTDRAGLLWSGLRRFGGDYGRTLSEWAERFEAAWPLVRTQGFDDRFRRLWRFYLAYCQAGFRTGRTDVVQLTLERP